MQVELKGIQREVGITFIFVTHDQQEALTMSDRIAVFNAGRIEQVGPPAEVYERPQSEFVAGFVGTSNLLRGEVARRILGPRRGVERAAGENPGARPGDTGSARHPLDVRRGREVVYVGDVTRFVVELDAGGQLVALQQNLETSSSDVLAFRGRRVVLAWRPDHEFAVVSAAGSPPAGGV